MFKMYIVSIFHGNGRISRASLLNGITIIGMILTFIFIIYGIKNHLFSSQDSLKQFLEFFGIWAPIIFILFQIVQVIFPILPGSIGCIAGIIFWGPVVGTIYNYIGICLGSFAAFYLSRKLGSDFVKSITKHKLFGKYKYLIEENSKFDKWFAMAIFFPLAPDDFLCYLAGLTKITYRKFAKIILLGKPFGIIAYSFGLNFIVTKLISII